MARRIEFEVVVDSDGAVTALKQIGETADEAGEQIEEMGDEGAKASRGLSASLSGLKGAFGAVAAGAAAAAAAVAAVGTAVINMAATNDEIAKMAATLGTTAEELQIVTGALGLGGVGAEQAAQAIRDLNLRLGDAELRGGAAGEALERLGLSAQQLEALPLAERFALIADRLQGIESQSLRARTAADLMGEAGVRLLSAFQDGGEGIRAAAGAIERAGIVSNEAAADSEDLTDQITLLSASFASLTRDFLEPLIPVVQGVAAELTELIQVTRRYTAAADEMSQRALNAQRVEVYSDALRRAEEELGALLAAAAEAQSRQDFAGMERLAREIEEAQEKIVTYRELQDRARGSFREYAQAAREASEAVEEQTEATTQEVASVEQLNEALKETIKLKIDLTEKTEELQHKSADEAAAIVAAADAQRAAADKRVTSMQQLAGMQEATNQQILSSSIQIIGLIQRAEQDALNQRMQQEQAAADRVRSIREQLARATTERTRERLREELDAAIGSQRIAEEQARQAFARTKALALGQAVISTAQAVASALAVPPAPNVPLAIAAGALGGAQIAAIASEPAPSFHSGGLLRDEMLIRARQGEGILSPVAVKAAGGEEGVRALNQGRPVGPTTLVVQQKLRTRVLDAQVYDLGRSGRGSLQNQIHRGQPRPGSHRPTGMG